MDQKHRREFAPRQLITDVHLFLVNPDLGQPIDKPRIGDASALQFSLQKVRDLGFPVCPFSAWDMEVGGTRWLMSKVMRQVKVPPLVAFAIDCHDEYKLPVLRLVSTGDLMAAIKVMVPIAKGEGALDFDMKSLEVHQVMALAINFSFTAKRIVVLLCDAIEYREGKDAARLMREAKSVHKRLKAKLDARLVDIRGCKIKADEMTTIEGETVAAAWLFDQCERIRQTAAAA